MIDADEPADAIDRIASEESALVLRVQRGDMEAFDVLVRRYMARAYRVAYRIVQHRHDAEDLVQESFLRALERIDQCAADRRFGPWFFRIVVTQGLNAMRQRKRRERLPAAQQYVGTSRRRQFRLRSLLISRPDHEEV